MKSVIYLISLCIITGCHAIIQGGASQPGQESCEKTRIVNGVEAVAHEFPHMVLLKKDSGCDLCCGGSLISSEWVLTAGYCCFEANTIQVLAGAHNQVDPEASAEIVNSSAIIIHEDFDPNFLENNVCVIKLSSPVDVGKDEINPIALANENPSLGDYVIASGWGKTFDYAEEMSDVLMKTTNPVISNTECKAVFSDIFVNDQSFCTSTAETFVGNCFGDYGGPLMWDGPNGRVLAGVISFVPGFGCGYGFPNGFASVSYFRSWITEQTGIA